MTLFSLSQNEVNPDPIELPRQRSVLLVVRHPLQRRQLATLFAQALPGSDVHAVDRLAAARHHVTAHPPAALLVDTRLDDASALDIGAWLLRVSPQTVLVFLSLAAAEAVQAAIERLGGGRVEPQSIMAALQTDAPAGGYHGAAQAGAGGHIPFLMPGFAAAD